MASDETMIGVEYSSTGTQGEDDDNDEYEHDDQSHPLNLSMMCTSNNSMYCHQEDDDDGHDNDGIRMFMSRLSIESFDGDGDEKGGEEIPAYSDSDKEAAVAVAGCYSLPATLPPPQGKRGIRDGVVGLNNSISNSEQQLKEYAGSEENEADGERRRRMRGLGIGRQRWGERAPNCINYYHKKKELDDDDQEEDIDGGGGGEPGRGGVVLITRAKGGRRTLRMDLEEVKACYDLGFELEHHQTIVNILDFIPIPTQTPTTSGDDPRDVKTRLKVWAQAVALASTSGHPLTTFNYP